MSDIDQETIAEIEQALDRVIDLDDAGNPRPADALGVALNDAEGGEPVEVFLFGRPPAPMLPCTTEMTEDAEAMYGQTFAGKVEELGQAYQRGVAGIGDLIRGLVDGSFVGPPPIPATVMRRTILVVRERSAITDEAAVLFARSFGVCHVRESAFIEPGRFVAFVEFRTGLDSWAAGDMRMEGELP